MRMDCGDVEVGYKMLTCPLLLLLDHSHCLTLLVVRRAHAWVQHNLVKETLAEVRMKFWIIGGRSLVKLYTMCVVCR